MWSPRHQNGSDALALEASAGLSLACAYSSSEEFEAEVVQVRRKAGAYASHYRQAHIAVAASAATAAIIAVVFLAI